MIRPGEQGDAQQVAMVRRRACRVAYAEFVDPDLLEMQEDLHIWERRLGADDGPVIWVDEVDGRIAGFAAVGEYEGSGVLHALYVDPVAQGAGVGTRLHERAMETMRERGQAEGQLWVIADNRPARDFFEGLGWEKEEGTQDNDPDWHVKVYRYRKAL